MSRTAEYALVMVVAVIAAYCVITAIASQTREVFNAATAVMEVR